MPLLDFDIQSRFKNETTKEVFRSHKSRNPKRIRSYSERYDNYSAALSCKCGLYVVYKNMYLDGDWAICPECGNTDFLHTRQLVFDYIRAYDNPKTIRLVCHVSSYKNIDKLKRFARKSKKFTFTFNKETHITYFKCKKTIKNVSRTFAMQSNYNILMTRPDKYEDLKAIWDFQTMIAEHSGTPLKYVNFGKEFWAGHSSDNVEVNSDMDSIGFVSSHSRRMPKLLDIQELTLRARYPIINKLKPFRKPVENYHCGATKIPSHIAKKWRTITSEKEAYKAMCGFSVGKKILHLLDSADDVHMLEFFSKLTTNIDAIHHCLIHCDMANDGWFVDEYNVIAQVTQVLTEAQLTHSMFVCPEFVTHHNLADCLRMYEYHIHQNLPIPRFRNLRQWHDDLAFTQRRQKTFKPTYSFLLPKDLSIVQPVGDFTFEVCRTNKEILHLGERLNNCVASYVEGHARHEYFIVGMYKEGRPIACIQIKPVSTDKRDNPSMYTWKIDEDNILQNIRKEPKLTHSIVQVKANCNRSPTDEVLNTIIEWAEMMHYSPKCSDLGMYSGTITGHFHANNYIVDEAAPVEPEAFNNIINQGR